MKYEVCVYADNGELSQRFEHKEDALALYTYLSKFCDLVGIKSSIEVMCNDLDAGVTLSSWVQMVLEVKK